MQRASIISPLSFGLGLLFASDVFCFYAQLPNISQYFYVPIYYEIILAFFCILASLVFAVSHKQKIFGFWLFYFLLSGFFLDFRISRCVQNLEMEVLKYINKGEAHLGVVENESNIKFPANCYIEKSIALEIWRRVDFHIKCSDGNFLTISSYLNEGLPARTFVR
ncbi:hypothetical protein LJR164_004668 [Phenylobacterium sp. LjRoot164]|uniref:hypothetical protein n=1 Tax=Pseudomonadota TaxID=1224 RepID=UPI003ECD24F9